MKPQRCRLCTAPFVPKLQVDADFGYCDECWRLISELGRSAQKIVDLLLERIEQAHRRRLRRPR